MNRKWVPSVLLTLAGMVIILAFAYGCDQVSVALNARISQLFNKTDVTVVFPMFKMFSNLISMGGVLFLFWMVMTQTSRSRFTGVIFLLVGFLLAANLFLYLNLGPVFPYLPFIFSPTPDSLFSHTAAGTAVIGLFILFLPNLLKLDKG